MDIQAVCPKCGFVKKNYQWVKKTSSDDTSETEQDYCPECIEQNLFDIRRIEAGKKKPW